MVDCSPLSQKITDLAMNIAADDGVATLDDVLAKMQASIPLMRRDLLVDAISEATTGQAVELSDLAKKLNAIKQEARTDKALRDKAAALQKHLEEGTLPDPQNRKKATTEAIKQLRSIRDDLKKQVRKSEPAVKYKLESQIADLEQRIASGDIFPSVRPEAEPLSKELEMLQYQRDRLRLDIRNKINSLKPKTIWERTAEPFNAIRAIWTSYDLSAMLRQGGFIVLSHPGRATKSIVPMLKAFASEKQAFAINNEILNRANAPLYARSKLFIAPIDGSSRMSGLEEAYMSRWAEKIPGVAQSERAYLTFLNKLRADSFDAMISTLSRNGTATQEEMSTIANFINVATGRGNLGKIDQAAVALNTVFFAPRYVASRFQLLLGQPLYRGTAKTRKLIVGEYARYLAGLGVVYLLAHLSGAEIEDDPRSANFGKIKFGYTRIDPLSGISQGTVLLSRMITRKTKSSLTGEITPLTGDIPYGAGNLWDVITRFGRTKLSPMFGMPTDLLIGENVVGEKVTIKSAAADAFVPLSMKEIYETMQEQGVPKGAAMGVLGIFGAGIQTYGRVKLNTPQEVGSVTYQLTGKKMTEKPLKVARYLQILQDNEVTQEQAAKGLAAYFNQRYGHPKTTAGQLNRAKTINERIGRYANYLKESAKQ